MVARGSSINSFAGNRSNQNNKGLQLKHKPTLPALKPNYAETGSSSSESCASIGDTAYLNDSGHKSQLHYVNSHGSIFNLVDNQYNSSQSGASQQQISYVQQNDVTSSSGGGSSLELANSQSYQQANNTGPFERQLATGQSELVGGRQKQKQQQQNHQQEQHRRLQFQVHQQLQRIYGKPDSEHNRSAPKAGQSCIGRGCSSHQLLMDNCQASGSQHEVKVAMARKQLLLANGLTSERSYDTVVSEMQQDQEADHFVVPPRRLTLTSSQSKNGLCNDELIESDYGDRRARLDELHYATATAAALLNATANAAAAIAASAEKQRQQKLDGIYSDVYQELARRQDQAHEESPLGRVKRQQVSHHQLLQETQPESEARSSASQRPTSSQYQSLQGTKPQVYDRQQPQQQHVWITRQSGAQERVYQPLHPIGRMPTQPSRQNQSVTMLAGLNASPKAELIRQYQQQLMRHQKAQLQQLVPPLQSRIIPTMAIVHNNHMGKGSSSKSDLRLVFGNLVAGQSEATQTASALENPYAGHLSFMDKNRVAKNSQLAVANRSIPVTLNSAPMVPALRVRPALFPYPRARDAPGGALMITSSSGTNVSSGGLVERACQVDLRMFWWSLLVVSFFFVAATITISRYIY